MSDKPKTPYKQAQTIAVDIRAQLEPYCTRIIIGGSLRRQKPQVGDIEIVAQPHNEDFAADLRRRLDEMVMHGIISKHEYGAKKTHRWGAVYRGFDYKGMLVEVFLADQDNWGYILALRTGPGEANTWLMSILSAHTLGLCFKEGYAHQIVDKGTHKEYIKLSLPEEADFFRVLDMPYLKPEIRSEKSYRMNFYKPAGARILRQYHAEEKQKKLF